MKVKDIENFDELLDDAEANAKAKWDMDFLGEIRDKYDEFEEEMYISASQLEQIERIAHYD